MSKSRLAFTNAVCFLRSLRRRRVRASIILLSIALVYTFLILPFTLWRSQQSELSAYDESIAHLKPPRVFVAAMLSNFAPLLSSHWTPALLGLIAKLGPDNVFVSILENGSSDETREILKELQTNLTRQHVDHLFQFEENIRDGVSFQMDGFLERLLGKEGTRENWIMTDKGWFPRRISYLAQLRNRVLAPLQELPRRYDKVLFINDVIFSVLRFIGFSLMSQPDDAIRLLHTNQGHYSAACGLDYFRPHLFYDTFAMRDMNGNPMISIIYPFFPQGTTRKEFLSRSPRVHVKSCWNGMGKEL
jgi:hypothetical protein